MKKYILFLAIISFLSAKVSGQAVKKDTVSVDSTQQEIINKMPMDTGHHNMKVKPLDSIIPRRDIDDIDPKKSNSPK